MRENQELFDFISESPTPFHAVAAAERRLQAAGFIPLQEAQEWALTPGGKSYVTRNRSALIAFAMPQAEFQGFLITASHCDSPSFKIKGEGEWEAAGLYTMLNTEGYGGMLCASWFDRPLGVAGRAVVRTGDGLETRLVDLDAARLVIPNLAIHMDRTANDGKAYNLQKDMLPLYGTAGDRGEFGRAVARAAGAAPEEVLATELYLYNPMRGEEFGPRKEFLTAPRLDDLECAFGTLAGFIAAQPQCNVNVFAMLDNEEVGSGTKQGADSNLLAGVLERVCAACGRGRQGYFAALAASWMLSADNAHAVHPAYPEKSDPVNRVKLNGGVVVKSHAGQKYTTDAASAAMLRAVADAAGVPLQWFTNRSDARGGSTLGNLSTTQAAINTVDIGLAQLAMHSCCETAGSEDLAHLQKLAKAFYETPITIRQDGSWRLV